MTASKGWKLHIGPAPCQGQETVTTQINLCLHFLSINNKNVYNLSFSAHSYRSFRHWLSILHYIVSRLHCSRHIHLNGKGKAFKRVSKARITWKNQPSKRKFSHIIPKTKVWPLGRNFRPTLRLLTIKVRYSLSISSFVEHSELKHYLFA